MNWFMTPWWFAQFAWMNNDVSRLIIADWLLVFSERLAENFAMAACDLKISFENCLHDVEMKLSSKWGEIFSESILTVHAVYSDSRLCSRLVNRRLGHTGVFNVCSIFPGFFALVIVLQLWMWTFLYFSDRRCYPSLPLQCSHRRDPRQREVNLAVMKDNKMNIKIFDINLKLFCAKWIWSWCEIRTLKSDIFCCMLT